MDFYLLPGTLGQSPPGGRGNKFARRFRIFILLIFLHEMCGTWKKSFSSMTFFLCGCLSITITEGLRKLFLVPKCLGSGVLCFLFYFLNEELI